MQRAFSLVELSLVLVILGLLTGGILAGQSLIRASQLRSVITEYQRYVTAVQSFRGKYFVIPGDMPDATRIWGRYSTQTWCVTSVSAPGPNTTTGVCDGDGNGRLTNQAASQSAERFQFWRELALAGLIEGTYNGISGTGGAEDCDPPDNCPGSRMANGAWHAGGFIQTEDSTKFYAIEYINSLMFGGISANTRPIAPIMTPEEAWNLDTKLDDGKPAYGKLVALLWNNQCSAADDGSSAADDLIASYRLSDNSLQCALIFRQLF